MEEENVRTEVVILLLGNSYRTHGQPEHIFIHESNNNAGVLLLWIERKAYP